MLDERGGVHSSRSSSPPYRTGARAEGRDTCSGRAKSKERAKDRSMERDRSAERARSKEREHEMLRQREKQIERMWNERAKFESEAWSKRAKDADANRSHHEDARKKRRGSVGHGFEESELQRARSGEGYANGHASGTHAEIFAERIGEHHANWQAGSRREDGPDDGYAQRERMGLQRVSSTSEDESECRHRANMKHLGSAYGTADAEWYRAPERGHDRPASHRDPLGGRSRSTEKSGHVDISEAYWQHRKSHDMYRNSENANTSFGRTSSVHSFHRAEGVHVSRSKSHDSHPYRGSQDSVNVFRTGSYDRHHDSYQQGGRNWYGERSAEPQPQADRELRRAEHAGAQKDMYGAPLDIFSGPQWDGYLATKKGGSAGASKFGHSLVSTNIHNDVGDPPASKPSPPTGTEDVAPCNAKNKLSMGNSNDNGSMQRAQPDAAQSRASVASIRDRTTKSSRLRSESNAAIREQVGLHVCICRYVNLFVMSTRIQNGAVALGSARWLFAG